MRVKLTTTALALALLAPGFALAQQAQPAPPAGAPAAPGGADVQVQQPAPQVDVQQPAPQVEVQQPAPQITVQQPKPEVTVTQPPPQVTIEQPKPEVTVTQPPPDVNVQQAPPQVEVQQPGQPNVQIEQPAQAEVEVKQPGSEQAEGGPAAAPQNPLYAMRGEEIVGKSIYGADGEEIGEIDDVVLSRDGRKPAALIGVGGFLGIGERNIAIPLDQLQLGENDRLTTSLTKESLSSLQPYDESRYETWDRTRVIGEGMTQQ